MKIELMKVIWHLFPRVHFLKNKWAKRKGLWMYPELWETFLVQFVTFVLCLIFFCFLLLEALHNTRVFLSCNSTFTLCAFISVVATKLVPSVPSECRSSTSTRTQLEPRSDGVPRVWLLYITWKTQGTKGRKGSYWLSTYSFCNDNVPQHAKERWLTFCFIPVGFVTCPL